MKKSEIASLNCASRSPSQARSVKSSISDFFIGYDQINAPLLRTAARGERLCMTLRPMHTGNSRAF
jgi:hypothetical protein